MTVQRLSDYSLTCRRRAFQLPDSPIVANIRLKEAEERVERMEKAERMAHRNQTAEESRLKMLEETLKTWDSRHESVAVRHFTRTRLSAGAVPDRPVIWYLINRLPIELKMQFHVMWC